MNKKLIVGIISLAIAIGFALIVAVVVLNVKQGNNNHGGGVSNYRSEPGIPSEQERSELPDCTDVLYTEPFIEISKINEITPLGNTEPPGHTFPTNHMYIHLFEQNTQIETLPLYAPGDIWLTYISESSGFMDPLDYSFSFGVCKDVVGYFNHVKLLSPEMQVILDGAECLSFGSGPDECVVQVFIKIDAGTYLGEVGRLQGNFDFGTYDFRNENYYISPDKYGQRTLFMQCGFDYYAPELRSSFVDKFPTTAGDNCGKNHYDILGTLQGNWFNGDAIEPNPSDWVKHLYIGYDNDDPSFSVLSIGGTVTQQPQKWLFTASQSGTVNLAPELTVPGNIIYCFDRTNDAPSYRYRGFESGKMLMQLVNEMEMKIEYQSGNCIENLEFTDSAAFYER